ncbi:MAG: outer membrane beta-barrel protein [Bacteroidales bacterium]|nr:outer membrane beta-barrel protein [Candidatus Scybalousia scybalohippi]
MKSLKHIFLFFVLSVLMSLNVNAQFFKGFVSGGFSASQIDGDEVYGFKKVGFTGGIGAMMPFNADRPNEGLQFSLEINYSNRGAKENHWGDPFKYEASLDYIDIPVMVHWIDKRGGVTLGIGAQYGRLVHSYEAWGLTDTLIHGMERPLTTNARFDKNDWSFVGDLRFTMWQKFKIDVRYQYSLVPIRKDFEFFNSYNLNDNVNFRKWTRDFKSSWVTVKLIYMINEEQEVKSTPKRKTAF